MYSTAVHLVANRLELVDVVTAYRYASALATVALNLPKGLFSKLRVPNEFSPWGERNKAALSRFNRGYAYLLMLHHANPGEIPEVLEWLDGVVQRAGLPDLAELDVSIRDEIERSIPDPRFAPYPDRLKTLLDIGTSLMDLLGVVPRLSHLLENLDSFDFCPVVCNDLQWSFLGRRNPLHDEQAVEDWIDRTGRMFNQFSEFEDSCF
jgi:hypothetical protein